jgi:hypothetical protein
MEFKNQKIIAFIFACLLSACGREELPVQYNRYQNAKTLSVDLGVDYSKVSGFSFKNEKSVYFPAFDAWNIVAGNREGDFFIELNSALLMQFAVTEHTDVSIPVSIDALFFRADLPQWHSDSLNFTQACLSGKVIILHLGFALDGRPKGYAKLQCTSNLNQVQFVLHSMQNVPIDSFSFLTSDTPKYYALDSKQYIDYPDLHQFDFIFTRYTHIFPDPYMPYMVTGVLCANPGVRIAVDTVLDFSVLSLQDTAKYQWVNRRDGIGYDWKKYSFTTQTFEILDKRNYIINTSEGWYYKLRFLDFYDKAGNKGYITFEYQLL